VRSGLEYNDEMHDRQRSRGGSAEAGETSRLDVSAGVHDRSMLSIGIFRVKALIVLLFGGGRETRKRGIPRDVACVLAELTGSSYDLGRHAAGRRVEER
jgi:hypothetical protein